MNDYIEVGGRCKANLWLTKHRVIKTKSRGYRCKYCDQIISDLRYQQKVRKKK